ncbi:MAG: Uncharacterized protein G01um10147_68 [Microgenomates group bacterium Gr01-1014_7]|nr:MAG: Uncharacterized protein G01um10147_68 [Microgenomates group bacterium Gr01-1014_7]
MLIFQTLIYGFIFLILFFLLFYPFGFWLLHKTDNALEDQEVVGLSLCIGVILFVLTAILFGLLNLRFLVLPLLLILNVGAIVKFRHKILKPWKIFLYDKLLLVILILGILVQGFINFPSGFQYKDGLYFWSSQGHDGLWHVSSMEAIKESIPPQNPGFSGEVIYNYHYLVDVLMGEFARLFPMFSSLDLYFRFFPVVFSFLIGITIFAFVTRWQNNRSIGYLGLFFTYFVGSFGYIVNYLHGGSIFGGETTFWAAQQNTILGNPPHATSHFLLPAFFLAFLVYIQKRNIKWVLISFLIGSILAGFKVSGGFVMLVGLGAAALVDLIFYRKLVTPILAIALGLSNIITFRSMTSPQAASFLIFLPWWFVRTMVVVKLDWVDLELRRQFYLSLGTWNAKLRIIQFETMALFIFVAGNLGMRILGLLEIIRKIITSRGKVFIQPVEVMLLVSMMTGLIVPLLFVQKGLIYNNIQFMQYFLLIFGFYGAVATYKIILLVKNYAVKVLIMVLIVCFSIPTVIGNLVEFYGPTTNPLAKISNSELQALSYLKNNSDSEVVVLNMPFNKNLQNKFTTQPKPIYAWYDTSYISALTGRVSYLASEHVTLLFYPTTDQRIENKKRFFEQTDFAWNREFLQKAKISFIYVAKNELDKPLDMEKNGIDVFFENDEALILKVKK